MYDEVVMSRTTKTMAHTSTTMYDKVCKIRGKCISMHQKITHLVIGLNRTTKTMAYASTTIQDRVQNNPSSLPWVPTFFPFFFLFFLYFFPTNLEFKKYIHEQKRNNPFYSLPAKKGTAHQNRVFLQNKLLSAGMATILQQTYRRRNVNDRS